ncbi:MAG: hypothetical protein RLZZ584_457 [Pseudomonadota bacterium]
MMDRPLPARAAVSCRYRRLRAGFMSLVACAALAGCGSVATLVGLTTGQPAPAPVAPPPPVELRGLVLAAEPDANRNSPVALDIVFVNDMATLERLAALSAARWFATRDELQRLFPDVLKVHRYELVPRQILRVAAAELAAPAVGVLLFADYATPGEHRARLPLLRDGGLIRLGPHDFTITDHRL